MDGFVELDSDAGHGLVWVRVAHITGIRLLEIHDLTGATRHTLSVLAGGEWFSDPLDHATAADAEARANVFAGRAPATRGLSGLAARISAPWRRVTP